MNQGLLTRRSISFASFSGRCAIWPRSAGHLYVEAVGKPLWEFAECHTNNPTSQNAQYGPISNRGMVKGPPQPIPIHPSGGFQQPR
jgi:hypothetical protein